MRKRYILTFPSETIDQPVTYKLIKDYDLEINILKASISAGEEGHLLIGIGGDQEKIRQALLYLESININYSPIEKQITFKSEQCVHCGSCTAVCFSGALIMNKDTWQMEFSPAKCTVCGLCTKACPLQLFDIDF